MSKGLTKEQVEDLLLNVLHTQNNAVEGQSNTGFIRRDNMDAVEFLKAKTRMTKKCGIGCGN